jgi:hypothetical protein
MGARLPIQRNQLKISFPEVIADAEQRLTGYDSSGVTAAVAELYPLKVPG